jgi:hypothetical protein
MLGPAAAEKNRTKKHSQAGFFRGLSGKEINMSTPVPQIANPAVLIAVAAQGPVTLGITEPTEPGGPILTVTFNSVPGYGTVQYLNGGTWTDVTTSTTLTPAQLATLRYVSPASGEHSGDVLSYSVSDGVTTVTGTMNVSVVVDSNGLDNLYFGAVGPGITGLMGPDLFVLDSNGTVTPAPLRSDAAASFGSFPGQDGGYVQFAGDLYFFAFTPTTGQVLYKLSPTGLVTAVGDGNGGFYGDPQENAHFTQFDGSLYFEAFTSSGDEVVKLNADGTSQVIVLNLNEESFAGAMPLLVWPLETKMMSPLLSTLAAAKSMKPPGVPGLLL